MSGRSYTDGEVREILRRAVDLSSRDQELTRSELISAAQDVGIDERAVLGAIEELDQERGLSEEIARMRSERRRSFGSSVATWAIVSAGLFGIHFASSGGELAWGGGGSWVYWVAGVWAMILLLKIKGALLMSPDKERKKALKRLSTERERQARQRDQARRRDASRRIESSIERGVEDLLGAAARRIGGEKLGGASSAPPRQGAAPAVRVHAAPPAGQAYRVDGDQDEPPAATNRPHRSQRRS